MAERCACTSCTVHDRGLRGPFTPREFLQLVELVEQPAGPPPSARLQELDAAIVEARDAFDAADRTWHLAAKAHRDAADRERGQNGPQTTAAKDVLDLAREDRDRADAALVAARVAYNEQAQLESRQRQAQGYAADLLTIEAAREAAKQERRTRVERSVLRRIRDRVSA